jgi:hypothetical protein
MRWWKRPDSIGHSARWTDIFSWMNSPLHVAESLACTATAWQQYGIEVRYVAPELIGGGGRGEIQEQGPSIGCLHPDENQ